MGTKYPFKLSEEFLKNAPAPDRNGQRLIDVKYFDKGSDNTRWDGVLVINNNDECIGIKLDGKIQEYSLPFEPAEIIEIRPSIFRNRVISSIPHFTDVYTGAPYLFILIIAPIFLGLSMLLNPFWSLGAILFAFLGTIPIFLHIRQLFCITGCPILTLALAEIALASSFIATYIIKLMSNH